jgi:hypothetical protein
MNSYIINYKEDKARSISAFIDGKAYSLNSGHANFKAVCQEFNKTKPDYQKLKKLFNVQEALRDYVGKGKITIESGAVLYNGQPTHNIVANRIMAFMREGLPYQPLLRFLENLMQNPSARSREETYRFVEALNSDTNGTPSITITADGCFLAYKGVDADYYSLTSGKLIPIKGKVKDGRIYNAVGEKIEVERGSVDDNCNRTCSFGLHVGSYKYANDFAGSSGKLVVVKVNPKDVVSIPTDASGQKCRTAAYEVVDELPNRGCVNRPYVDDYDDVDGYGESKPARDAQGRFVKKA